MWTSWRQCFPLNSICHPYCHTYHLHRFFLTRLVGMQQGYKHTFNNLRWVSYFSRSVIIIIYFPLNMISKKYFSWIVMRPLYPSHLCELVYNVYKQTTPEIPEVTCTRRTIMDFLHETSLIWVISLGVKLWLVYFRSLHICKNKHINAKYVIKQYKYPQISSKCQPENCCNRGIIDTHNTRIHHRWFSEMAYTWMFSDLWLGNCYRISVWQMDMDMFRLW